MNKIQTPWMTMSLLAVGMVAMSGCGAGGKLVKSLKFASETIDSQPYTGFDANVNLGQVELPYATLPIFSKKNKAIGYIGTGGSVISVRLSLNDLTNGNIETSAATLPNGRPLPVSLPADVIPMAIPIKGSNAKVYFAIGSQNIMAGVGLTLKVTETDGNLNSWEDYLGINANIFFPFTISSSLKGTAGVFTGEKFGVGVFAVQTLQSNPGLFSGIASISKSSIKAGPEFFGVKHQEPSRSNLNRINRALNDVSRVELD